MDEIILETPDKRHEGRAKEFVKDFSGELINGGCGIEQVGNYDEWLEYLDKVIHNMIHNRVPSYIYFAIRKNDLKIVGIINVRCYIKKQLLINGGHIGYSVAPSERNKGYSKTILKLGLEKARELGIFKVLMVCRDDNIISEKTIKSCGGKFSKSIEFNNKLYKHYYIDNI